MNPFEMNRIDLGGKVALVNGASRGIGEAIARGLAGCGAHVVLSSRGIDGVEPVAEAIRAEGGTASVRACHAGRLEEIDALFESIDEELGRLDILVNNAATNPYYGPAGDLPPEAFDKTVAVNLKGPYFMMSRAVPLMIRGGGGSIVNVASIAAMVSMAGQAVYSMTKAGLISLTRSFAREYGQSGVRVNAILPGIIDTRFATALVEDPGVQKRIKSQPVPRFGQPDDMVAGVLFLVSDHASFTTGTSLIMDGGVTLG